MRPPSSGKNKPGSGRQCKTDGVCMQNFSNPGWIIFLFTISPSTDLCWQGAIGVRGNEPVNDVYLLKHVQFCLFGCCQVGSRPGACADCAILGPILPILNPILPVARQDPGKRMWGEKVAMTLWKSRLREKVSGGEKSCKAGWKTEAVWKTVESDFSRNEKRKELDYTFPFLIHEWYANANVNISYGQWPYIHIWMCMNLKSIFLNRIKSFEQIFFVCFCLK